MEPIRCVFLAPDEKQDSNTHDFSLEDEHNHLVQLTEHQETLVDIGRDPWPHHWDKKVLTYKLISHTDDLEFEEMQERALTVALRAIGLHIPVKFKRERDPNVETDITVEFRTDDPYWEDRPSVLAYAWLYHPRGANSGQLVFNDAYFWTIFGEPVPAYLVDPVHYKEGEKDIKGRLKTLRSFSLLHVLLHELIHMLGFYHDENEEKAIMWPYAKRGYIIKVGLDGEQEIAPNPEAYILHDRDIKRLQDVYGKRGLSMWIIDYFRKRRLRKSDFRKWLYK